MTFTADCAIDMAHAALLRDLMGPLSWAVESARIDRDRLEVDGWVCVRDGDACNVSFLVAGEPVTEVATKPIKGPGLNESMWYAGEPEKAIFRFGVPLRDADARALRVDVAAPGVDRTWQDGHSFYVPGPAAVDADVPIMLSFLGDHGIARAALDADTLDRVTRAGSLFIANDEAIDRRLGALRMCGTAFQRTAAAASEAAQWFDVLEIVPAGIKNHQDLLVLRRGNDNR